MKKILFFFIFYSFLLTSQAQTNIVIGTGGSTSNGSINDPIDDYFKYMRYQTVYTAAELSAAGMIAYNEITALGFSVSQASGALTNYTIRIGHTSETNAAANINTTLTTVRNAASYTPQVKNTNEFDMLTFNTNFVWNGSDNIVIDICTGLNPYESPHGGVRVHTLTNGSRFSRTDLSDQCSVNTNSINSYRPQVQFTYLATTCTTPTALGIGSVTNNSASASFTSGGSAFIVEYGVAGFTPGSNGNAGVGGTVVSGSASPIALTGLTSNTTYDVYVRQDCSGSGNGYSNNSSKVTFTTLCDAITTYPFTEGFNSASLPACWYASEGSPGATQHWQTVTADGNNGAGASAEGSHFLRMNYYLASASYNPYYLKSVPFNLGATAKRAKFSIWMGYYSGPNNLKFEISTDGGLSWTTLSTFTNNPANYHYSSPWISKTVDLSAYSNQTVIFRLNATSNYGENYCNIGFDDFRVEEKPPCTIPTALGIGSITTTSALASFTSSGSAFIVEYGAAGFTPGTDGNAGVGGTIVTGSTSPIVLTGLTSNTTYDVYVRQDCTGDANGYSLNSSKATFTTLCTTQGDEVSYGNDLWRGYVYTWTGSPSFNSANYKGYVTENEQFDRDNALGAIAGLTTNLCLPIPSDGYTVRYKMIKNFSAGYYKFSVGGDDGVRLSVDGGNTWLVNVWNDQSYTIYTSSTVFLNGSTNLILEYYENTGDSRISFSYTIPCSTPTAFNIGSITATSASASFTSGGSAFIIEYGAAGFTPGTNGSAGVGGTVVTGTASPIALSGLTNNTTYDVYVRQDCTGDANGYSLNSSKATFTTLCTPQGDEVSYGNDSWKGYVYTWTGSPSFNSSNYKGYVTENEQFDRDNGGGAIAGLTSNLCPPIPSNGYTVRYKMTKNFPAGYYKFSVGGDDGVRLSVDGGNTWLVNEWIIQSYAIFTSSLVYLNGSTNLVFEYFENDGDSRISFSYTIPCSTPTTLSIGSITNSSASASFTSSGNAFIVEYGAAGFTPGTNGSAGVGGTIVTGTASPIELTGLTGNTTYDVYVRQDCSGSGNGYSVNSSKATFTTACDAINTYPFTEGFNNASLPACWFAYEGSPGAWEHWQPAIADANGAGSSAEGSHFLRMYYLGAHSDYNPYYLKSVAFNLGATAKRAKFSIWMGANSGTNNLKFEISTDSGSTWTTLSTYTANPANNNANAPWENKIVNLSAYTNQTVLFRLNATKIFSIGYTNIGFDNFRVEEIPPCTTPTALSIGSITTTSASLSFTGVGSAFIVEYGAVGFTPGTDNNPGVGGTVVTGTASPIALTGLTGNTTYDVYVRQDCTSDVNGYSTNSSKTTFTTACDAINTYPFTEGFNNASLPACWSVSEGSPGATQHWEPVTTDNGNGAEASAEGSHFLRMNYNVAQTSYNPYYLKSVAFNLGATAKRAKFSIWMGANSGTNNLKFEISTDGGNSWTTLSTYTANPANNNANAPWVSKTVDLSAYSNQTVLFRLNATSNYGGSYCNIGFDNFRVEDIPACTEPEDLSVGSVTNSSASVSFTGVGSAFVLEYGAAGFTPGTNGSAGVGGTVVTGSASPIAISGLTGSTTYDVYIRQDCSGSGNGYSVNSSKTTFTTLCDTINTYPFTEGFNNASLPACWSVSEGSLGATQHWEPVTTDNGNGAEASAEGSHFLRINYNAAQTSYNPYYLKSVAFNLGATPKRAKFSIWMGANSSTNNLKFEISTDGGGTWTTLSTYTANPANNNANAPWENKIVNLSAYSNQTVLFRLNATSNWGIGYCNIGFDNFRVEEIPPCTTPTALSIGSITNSSASASFTGVGSAFIVEYGSAGFTPGTDNNPGVGGTVVTGSASPIAISGLIGSTIYDVYVRQDCTSDVNGYSTNSSKATFTTLCDTINTYPFTEGFNNASLPACWSVSEGSPGATQHWQIVTGTYYGAGSSAEGSHFLNIDYNAAKTTYNPYYLNSAPFNLGATAKRAKFSIWMGVHSGTNNLKFEISTDGGSTWTTLSTYTANPANNNPNAPWENKIVNLSAYSNQTVLFRLNATSNWGIGYCNIGFDNFRVEEIPPCTTPTALSIGSITTTSASLSFTSVGSAFIVEYGAPGFIPGTNGNAGIGGTIVTGSASPIVLTGLSSSTTYDVYVRQDCTSDDNGYSTNSSKVTFITLCNAAVNTYPFTEGFNNASLPTCWFAYEGSPGAWKHWEPVTTDNGDGAEASAEGSHFLRINYNAAPTSYNPYYLKSVAFNLGATAKRAKFSIWMGANSGANSLKFEISTDGGNSWTTLSTYTANPANNNANAPWVSKTVDLFAYSNLTVLFRLNATSNYSSNYCNIGFDNFRVEDIPACTEPEDLSVGSVTNSSASVSFTGFGSAFVLEYGAAGFTPGTNGSAGVGGTVVTGSASPIAISGLTGNTTYDVYIRKDCTGSGNGYSVNSSKTTFTTACDIITTYPFTEGFNSASLPACWSVYEGSPGASRHWQPVTSDTRGARASAEGSHFLRMKYEDADYAYNPYYLQSGSFNLGATAKRAKFSIWMGANSGTNNLKFEISTDGGNSWTTLRTYTANSANNNTYAPWENKKVDLSSYINQTVVFRLNATSNYGSGYCNIGFDNFRVEDIPACIEAEDVSVGSITNSSASVSFTGVGSAFIVEYGAPGFTPGTDGNAGVGGTVVAGSASPISIYALTAYTTYDVYVRQNCTGSGNGYSTNSSKVTFTTLCNATTVPYTQNFETATEPALPDCTTQEKIGYGNYWVTYDNPGNGFTTKTLIYEYNSDYAANTWFYTQGIHLTQGTSYTISYRYGNNNSFYPEKLKVAYGTSPSNGAMTNTLADHPNINQATPQSNTVTFTPPSTGVYYFGFNAYSDADMYYLLVDDIVIDIVPWTWTGTTNTDWNTASNWDRGTVPTSISNIIIPNVTNKPVLGVNYTIIREANNITIQTGSSLTITKESSFLVYGNFINNGTIIADTGKIAFVGTSLQTFNTGSTDIILKNLAMDNAVGLTVTGIGKLNIIGDLITYKQGVLTTNNLIVLKSNENGTAFFQSLFNLSTINGNVTVERYIPAKASRKWSFLTSPIRQNLNESWQQQIHITGAGTGGTVCPTLTSHSNGFDATLTNAPNAYTYDASQTTGNRWKVVNNTNATMLGHGTGFRINVRGPRSLGCDLLNGINMVPSAVTLSTTGTFSTANKNMGTFSITYPNNGINNWVLIGNPYPGHLAFNKSYGLLSDVSNSNNIEGTYAVYIPSNNAGVYTYWSDTDWEFTGGTGYKSDYGDFISSGQAVFVQSKVAGNITLNFNEDMKLFNPGVETGYFRDNRRTFNEKVKVSYGTMDNKIDEIVVRYANDAEVSNTVVGKMDIPSMNYGTYITSIKGNQPIVVQTRLLNTLSNDEVWLNIGATKSGNYKFTFSDYENFTGADIYLIDHLANIMQDVKQNTDYIFSVDINNAATKGSNRFSLVFTKRYVEQPIVQTSIKMYPNPANKQVTLLLPQSADISYQIKVSDMAGKIVLQKRTAGGVQQLRIDNLTAGSYFVEIVDSKGNRTTEKLVKQ